MDVQRVGERQGKLSRRRHPRPLSMHRNLRRREEARNGNKEQSWRWERWEWLGESGEGLCRAAVVGKGHGAAWSGGKLCCGTLLGCQLEKKSFCV